MSRWTTVVCAIAALLSSVGAAFASGSDPLPIDIGSQVVGSRCLVEWFAPAVPGLQAIALSHDAGGVSQTVRIAAAAGRYWIDPIPSAGEFTVVIEGFDVQGRLIARSNTERVVVDRRSEEIATGVFSSSSRTALTVDILGTPDLTQLPLVFFDSVVESSGVYPTSPLPTESFSVFEDGVLQTDMFEVFPTGTGILDFVLCIDNSGSMCSKINQVVQNVQALATSLSQCQSNVAFGYVRFGQGANAGCPMVTNGGALLTDVDAFRNLVQTQSTCDGGTEPGLCAVRDATSNILWRPGSTRHILLITDEDHDLVSCGPGGVCWLNDICQLVQSNGIVVHSAIDPSWGTAVADYWNGISACSGGLDFNVQDQFSSLIPVLCRPLQALYTLRYRTANAGADCIRRDIRLEVAAYGEVASDSSSYVPGGAPEIQRTPATIALSSFPQSEMVALDLEATVDDCARPIESVELYYRPTGYPAFSVAPMSLIGPGLYRGVIPASAVVTPGVDYYLRAHDALYTVTDPADDPVGNAYQIAVFPNVAPVIAHTPVAVSPIDSPIPIQAEVLDATLFVDQVELRYRPGGTFLYTSVPMTSTTGAMYVGTIPTISGALGIDYYIRAVDNFGVGSTHGSAELPHFIQLITNLPPVCLPGGPYQGGVCDQITFDGSASSDDQGIAVYRWNFGDGTFAEGSDASRVTHVYGADNQDSDYQASLTVTDDDGASSTCPFTVHLSDAGGVIRGKVQRLNGQSIWGAQIGVFRTDGSYAAPLTVSVLDGSYEIHGLASYPRYIVRCTHPDFWEESAAGISVCGGTPDAERSVNFTLVKRAEMTGVIATKHDGFEPGKTTRVDITVRIPARSTYKLKLEGLSSRFTCSPSSWEYDLGRCEKDQILLRTFQIACDQNGVTADPELLTVALKRNNNQAVDEDVIRVVADRAAPSSMDEKSARQLLERFQPIFRLHTNEPYVPKDIDVMLDRATMAWADDPIGGASSYAYRGLIGTFPEVRPTPVTRPYLDLFGNGSSGPNGSGPDRQYANFQSAYPARLYGTVVQDGEELYLSYWAFFYYEDWFTCVLAFAEHEGDWEGVTVVARRDGGEWKGDRVAYGHHGQPAPNINECTVEVLPWSEAVIRLNGRDVPVAFVAEQAHGCYPHARTVAECRWDIHDGLGPWIVPNDIAGGVQSVCGGLCQDVVRADIQYVPRFNEVSDLHAAGWMLFDGNYGMAGTAPAEVAPPRGPLYVGKSRWTDPKTWSQNAEYRCHPGTALRSPIAEGASAKAPACVGVEVRAVDGGMEVQFQASPLGDLTLDCFDVSGRIVRTLGSHSDATGKASVFWDLRDNAGRKLSSGVYFYRLRGDRGSLAPGKIVLMN